MKFRHAAALVLVGWYLLMAPTFRNPQTDSFTVDLNAPLSAWDLVSSYYSAADCESAERDLVDTARLYPNVIAFYSLCVPSDDPRLMERWAVKLRHTGALALVGWYLMAPPSSLLAVH
jgi:hypothetical protein